MGKTLIEPAMILSITTVIVKEVYALITLSNLKITDVNKQDYERDNN